MLQGYLMLFRLKTAKHTSNLGTEREAVAPTDFRGLVAGRFPAQGQVSVRRPGLFVASHGPGHVTAPGGRDTIRSIAFKSGCHDIGHRSPVAIDLEVVDGAPFDSALFDGPGLPLPRSNWPVNTPASAFRVTTASTVPIWLLM